MIFLRGCGVNLIDLWVLWHERTARNAGSTITHCTWSVNYNLPLEENCFEKFSCILCGLYIRLASEIQRTHNLSLLL